MRRRPSPAFVLAFVALVFSVSGVGIAAIPARDGDVHLCYSKETFEVQLVDTQSDRFACEKNWSGFILDSKPTQLVSPNGQFKVEATDQGARMSGPGGSIQLGSSLLTINGSTVRLTSDKSMDVVAGGAMFVSGGGVDLKSDRGDLKLTAAKRLAGTAGSAASLTGEDSIDVTSGGPLELTAGSDATVTAGKKGTFRTGADLLLTGGKNTSLTSGGDKLSITSGKDLGLTSGRNTDLTVGEDLDIDVDDKAALQAKAVELQGILSMLLQTKDFTVKASGRIDMKASGDVNIKGSKVKTNR